MRRRKSLVDAWSRFGTEMMAKVPMGPNDPRRMMEWVRAPTRIAGELHEAWLESFGAVSRTKYLDLLEENLELRRRIDELEARGPVGVDAATEAATGVMDDAFDRMRTAQEQWLSMWLPGKERGSS